MNIRNKEIAYMYAITWTIWAIPASEIQEIYVDSKLSSLIEMKATMEGVF